MKVKYVLRLAVAVSFAVLSTPCWADVYYGGFEDTQHALGDNDYNDIVFSISGVTLNSAATWFPKPTLNNSGNPFWNNTSADPSGSTHNIGYCIYGGGACGAGYDTTALYLATSSGGSANDVTFSAAGSVGFSVLITITADTDVIGWALTASPGTVHYLNPGGATGAFAFTPSGNFELVGNNANGSGGQTYYSRTSDGNGGDTSSHFAIFENPVPEPSSIILFASVVALAAFRLRRRNSPSV